MTDNFRNTGFFNNTATRSCVPFDSPTITHAGHVPPERHRRRQSPARPTVAAAYAAGSDRAVPRRPGRGRRALRSLRPHLPQQPQRRQAASASTISSRRAPASSSSRWRRCRSTAATACRIFRARAISSRRSRRSPSRSSRRRFTNYEVGVKWDVGAGSGADDRRLPAGPHQHALDRSERPDPHRADRQPAHQRLRIRRERPDHAARGASPAATPIRMPSSPAPLPRRVAGAQVGAGAASHVLAVEQLPDPRRAGGGAGRPLPDRHVRGHRQHRDAARLHARGRRGVLHRSPNSCASRSTSRTCSTGRITSTPTATRTSRPGSRGQPGWG